MIERVVFMGTPTFAVPALRAISEKYRVVGVYTQPDKPVGRGLELTASPVKKLALELGIPVSQPEKLSAPGEFEKLQALAPDVIVVAAYGQILKKSVLDLPKYGCLNIHSSLLPRWRGAAPIHWAILAGDPETGITTMKMAEGLDTGNILLQEATPVKSDDTGETLHDRLASIGGPLIVETLSKLSAGALAERVQDESKVTYAKKLTKELGMLWGDEDAQTLARKVRALNPWPGTWITTEKHGRLKVLEAQAWGDLSGAAPGQLVEKNGMILMGASKGALQLKRVQWEGKSPIGAVQFLNGLKGRGQRLPIQLSSKPA
jgi:methionyl-tRNA formyltransferase